MHVRERTLQDFRDEICRVRMMKRSHWKLELVCVTNEAFQVRDSIAVRVDKDLPTKHCGESFPLEVLWQIGSHARVPNVVCSSTPIGLGVFELCSFLKSMSKVPVGG